MQIPRDLSRRMIDAVEHQPVIDVYERLVPESRRVNERVDFIAWLVASAGSELVSLGLGSDEVQLLRDVDGSPDERWALLERYWPSLRTTNAGRTVLRVVWEFFGVENVDAQRWKDISAQLWRQTERGFYGSLLRERANVPFVLVDGPAEPDMKPTCVPIKGLDRMLRLNCLPEIEAWARSLGRREMLTRELLDTLIEQSVQRSVEDGCVAFKLGILPQVEMPSEEEVAWAFGRVSRCENAAAPVDPALQTYIGHRLLAAFTQSQLPVQIHVADDAAVSCLERLARQYPRVRFVAGYTGNVHAYTLAMLARSLPNVSLALVGVWRFAPLLARQTLRDWIHCVPLRKIVAFGGGMAVVENIAVQAMILREEMAALMAEMVAAGELDEGDALMALERLLYRNAVQDYGLDAATIGDGDE
jgi:hypothetical protein